MATPGTLTHRSRRMALFADVLLFTVAIVWGSSFVLVKLATETTTDAVSPAAQDVVAGSLLFLLLRYLVAAVVFAAIRPRSWLRAKRGDWAKGSLLGALYLSALVVQTIGLQQTSPGVSGFITGMNIAMVPFLYWLFAGRSPGRFQILGAIVATVGLVALSLESDFTMSWGNLLTLLGALLYAMHIMATGFFAPKVEASTLAMAQIGFSALALVIVTPFVSTITLDLGWEFWAMTVWMALTGTIYAFFIQSWGQRYTTSTHAAILLGFESVFAALTGVIVGMDEVTWRLLVGGSLMLVGVFIVELLPSSRGIVDEIRAEGGAASSSEVDEAGRRT
jgi:drug/metabolite transporter (DMT)-like permease